jgi:hypothetical protein
LLIVNEERIGVQFFVKLGRNDRQLALFSRRPDSAQSGVQGVPFVAISSKHLFGLAKLWTGISSIVEISEVEGVVQQAGSRLPILLCPQRQEHCGSDRQKGRRANDALKSFR